MKKYEEAAEKFANDYVIGKYEGLHKMTLDALEQQEKQQEKGREIMENNSNMNKNWSTKEINEYKSFFNNVKRDGERLELVPKKYKTPEMCEIAVKDSGYNLKYVALELRTKELCELAVSTSGWALEYAPREFKTKAMCDIAVIKNGHALKFVPEEFKTPSLCEIAIKGKEGSSSNLEYVPEEFKTEELCKYAMENQEFYQIILNYVPIELRTKEMCELAMQLNPRNSFRFVPDELKTEEFCLEGVTGTIENLYFVPENMKTYEICRVALDNEFHLNKYCLKHVPEEFHKELAEEFGIELPKTR